MASTNLLAVAVSGSEAAEGTADIHVAQLATVSVTYTGPRQSRGSKARVEREGKRTLFQGSYRQTLQTRPA